MSVSGPFGNKLDKARTYLNAANARVADPLAALGKAITELMEVNSSGYASDTSLDPERQKINQILAEHELAYTKGGYISAVGTTAVSRTLQDIISAHDLPGLQAEFDRIHKNIEADPASAVTASCALLESIFRTYVEQESLEMPSEQSIKPLWKAVRKDLKLDPALVDDDDLRTILSGLATIVEGMGPIRRYIDLASGNNKSP